MSELRPSLACMLDLNDDGRPEVLSVFGLASHRYPNAQDSSQKHRQQQFLALFDGRDGALQWAEPFTDLVIGEGWSFSAGDNLRWDASADLNGDGTRDFVLVSPKQNENRGWWSGELQARSGRDGKLLWTPQQLEGLWDDPAALKQPIVSDLDGDGHPEIVQLETTHPHIRVFRGDTGEPLWSWQASQNLSQMVPSVVTVGRRLGTLARPDLPSTSKDEKGTGKSAHPTRLVAVTIYETGANAELVLLDHTGKVAERMPTQGNWPIWSYDLDGDGAEELLRWAGNKIQATHGLHELLWDWSPPPYGSHSISYFERAADGRAVVAVTSGDALLMLDGSTGKPLGRTWKSCNTPLNENGRNVKLNRLKLNSAGESPRLVTRVGDGSALLNHVVSRAVLPTSADGRYELGGRGSRRADGDETAHIPKISSAEASPSRARGMAVDPRLVRQLPWAPSPRERSESIWIMLLMQTARAIMLSLMIVLIPFWMIRTGVRSRELGRWRGVVIVAGLAVIALSIAALQSLTPSPGMGGLPLGVKLAMAFGALPILAWPTTMLRSVFLGEWRRLMWLFGGSLLVAVVLAAILLATGSAKMPPEQHYSWHGWWFILLIGAYAVGGLLVVWRVVGPGVCWLWNFGRRKLVRHA